VDYKIKKFENILVLPWEHKYKWSKPVGGPVYPDWDSHTDIRHLRADKNWDTYPKEIPSMDDVEVNDTVVYYGGHIKEHFGHFIAEYLSRCVQYIRHIKRNKNSKLCLTGDSSQTWDRIPLYIKEILEFYGFNQTNVYIVNKKPVLFKNLYVCPQAEHLHSSNPTSNNYINLLNFNKTNTKQNRVGNYFISRTNFTSSSKGSGGLLGEKYLESAFKELGYTILYPEELTIKQQIKIYSTARELVFVEGSAIHGLQLLGKNEVNVTIFQRRTDIKIGYNELINRVAKLEYIPCVDCFRRLVRSRNDKLQLTSNIGGEYGLPHQKRTMKLFERLTNKNVKSKFVFCMESFVRQIELDYLDYINVGIDKK
jgi:hypothetical protein